MNSSASVKDYFFKKFTLYFICDDGLHLVSRLESAIGQQTGIIAMHVKQVPQQNDLLKEPLITAQRQDIPLKPTETLKGHHG